MYPFRVLMLGIRCDPVWGSGNLLYCAWSKEGQGEFSRHLNINMITSLHSAERSFPESGKALPQKESLLICFWLYLHDPFAASLTVPDLLGTLWEQGGISRLYQGVLGALPYLSWNKTGVQQRSAVAIERCLEMFHFVRGSFLFSCRLASLLLFSRVETCASGYVRHKGNLQLSKRRCRAWETPSGSPGSSNHRLATQPQSHDSCWLLLGISLPITPTPMLTLWSWTQLGDLNHVFVTQFIV